MSHLQQRTETNCLNCNAIVNGRYCSICGQENLQPQESIGHLVSHFFQDITHFDGKFFTSVKYILTKPGLLSSEYMAGRRMSYLNPVRFYVFTSALFFFIMYSFFSGNLIRVNEKKTESKIQSNDSLKIIKRAYADDMDSLEVLNIVQKFGIDSLNKKLEGNNSGNFTAVHFFDYRDRREFDSLDNLHQININIGKRFLANKQFDMQEKYQNKREKFTEDFNDNFKHLIPQMLVVSLPFFALILKLLYVRRKKYYYVSHVIFSIHFYIFIYIQIILLNISRLVTQHRYFHWMQYVSIFLGFGFVYYLYKSMRYFYGQGIWKTIFKMIILLFFSLILFTFLFVIFLSASLLKM